MQEILDIYKDEYARTGSEKALDIIYGLIFGEVQFFDCAASQLSIHCDYKSQSDVLNNK